MPNVQTAKFKIGKADYQMNNGNRLTARWIQFHNDAPYNSGGGTATLERATDFLDAMDSIAGQLVTLAGLEQAERAALPVRAPPSELVGELRLRHRAGDHDRVTGDRRSARRSAAPARATPASTSSRTSRR